MLAAYYTLDEDTENMFTHLKIAKTEDEVKKLCQDYQMDFEEASAWYNGYLEAMWQGDSNAVAQGIDKAHQEVSILQYNDENALSCTISLAFYAAREYYHIIRELPAGKGFADICLIPRKLHMDKPAAIIELKYGNAVKNAISQIRERQYASAFDGYQGSVLLVGINYDKSKASSMHY